MMIYSSWRWVVLLPLLTKPVSFVFFGGVISSFIIFPLLYSQEVQEWKGNVNNIHNMGSFYDPDNSGGVIATENYTHHPSPYTEVQVKTLLFSNTGSPQECNAKVRDFLNSLKNIQPRNISVVLTRVCINRGFAIGRFADDNTLISVLPMHDKSYNLAGVKIRKSTIIEKPTFLKSVLNSSSAWPALIIIFLSMLISYLLSLIAGGYLRVLNVFASTDGLTGCLRREAFYAKATYELAKCKKNNLPFSVLVIDLDHLREVNNSFGHEKGDLAISLCAEKILKCLRSNDFAGRVGGDEFIVALKNTGASDAFLIANRIREAVKSIKLEGLFLSVSIGISQYDKDNASLQEVISKADANLYIAKRQRNDVVY
ncbi:GGDEF domain-containing protein [Rahnella perminowiae]|uniref:GGDEF domain-containing protein n=1 Tax=Rahnella perminowiae TaxID=2816244 RepID=UPI001EE6104A|nr:GGDEF domain-containing protein [Rahnella perminowiae]